MKCCDLNSVQYFWTAVLIASSMLIAFVPPWLSLLFSSFNKQFLYCPPATKCILFSREQSGVVGPSEYASQHTCKSAYTMASEGLLTFIENICSTTTQTKKIIIIKSSLTNGLPFHSEAKVQATLHIHSAHQVHSAPSRTKYIDSRGNKQADKDKKRSLSGERTRATLHIRPVIGQ